jgi:type IV secretory pathway component VirB8
MKYMHMKDPSFYSLKYKVNNRASVDIAADTLIDGRNANIYITFLKTPKLNDNKIFTFELQPVIFYLLS